MRFCFRAACCRGLFAVCRYPGAVTGRYRARQSNERKITWAALVAGTLLATSLAFGPLWMAQLGVGVALLFSFVSVGFAWRELENARKAHRGEVKALLNASREVADRQHRESLEMLDRFDERANQLKSTVQRLTSQLGAAHAELASMRGNNVWLRGEVAERQARIDALTSRIAELEAARAEATGKLLVLPKREVCDPEAQLLPTAEELWADGNHPTVVDLTMLSFPVLLDERKQA